MFSVAKSSAQADALHCWLRAAFSALCRQMIQSPSQWSHRAYARPGSMDVDACQGSKRQHGAWPHRRCCLEHAGTLWKSLPGCIVTWRFNTAEITCQLFVQDRRDMCFSGKGNEEMYKFSSLDPSLTLDICTSTELGCMPSMRTLVKNSLPFAQHGLHTSIFSYASRT